MSKPLVGIMMGSKSDMEAMQECINILKENKIPHEVRVLSAHRTPKETSQYAKTAEKRGLKVIIAGAGMAAHLPGVVASYTNLPVIGVPMDTKALEGIDSLLSIVQMPSGVPVGCMAIGKTGAKNAAHYAIRILRLHR